jgi:hypothetical protein
LNPAISSSSIAPGTHATRFWNAAPLNGTRRNFSSSGSRAMLPFGLFVVCCVFVVVVA